MILKIAIYSSMILMQHHRILFVRLLHILMGDDRDNKLRNPVFQLSLFILICQNKTKENEDQQKGKSGHHGSSHTTFLFSFSFTLLHVRLGQVSGLGGHQGKHHEHGHDPHGEEQQHERRRRQWRQYQRENQQGGREDY
ncbi:hypothetical protein SAY87_024532 [Trapa incisa]|uniref:Uncharacterized protein n=1 Tax=Trapa incisa TaxID=236973 RepID=A0AAN7GG25_9MYRT|nr:hypothetical protein SAY87_024532 [Trapa incisa]